jgi:hypothetical protein
MMVVVVSMGEAGARAHVTGVAQGGGKGGGEEGRIGRQWMKSLYLECTRGSV